MGEVILKDGSIVLTEPIVPSDDPSSIRAQYGFDRDYKCLKSNSILLISDIHFSDNPHKFNFVDCQPINPPGSGVRLNKAILDSIKTTNIGTVICAGDITQTSQESEFAKADVFFRELSDDYEIDKRDMIIVPGNHDIELCSHHSDTKSPITYITLEASKNYSVFYEKIYGKKGTPFFAVGKKFLLRNHLPVEILGLNSNCLQQVKDSFMGMGFVGEKQLRDVAEAMGWENNQSDYAYRILVLHHHLFQVEYIEVPEDGRQYSLCLDAGQIYQFIDHFHINLVIHGHKHKNNFVKIEKLNKNKHDVTIIGLGSASSSELGKSDQNTVGIIDFNDKDHARYRSFSVNSEQAFSNVSDCAFDTSFPLF